MPSYAHSGLPWCLARSVLLASVGLGLLTHPVFVVAQSPPKVVHIGYLSVGGRTPDGAPPGPLREGLRDHGHIDGQTVVYEARFAEGKLERLPDLAAELVRIPVDVIVATGGPATAAARQATATIPIIMAPAAGDAVAVGWIASLPRPGGNVTGLTDESVQLSAKRMQLLKEAVPQAALIAVVWDANDPGMTLRYREIEKAAQRLHVEIQALAVRQPEDFAGAFATMTRRRPDAIFLVSDVLTNMNRKRVIEFATTHRIPAMYEYSLYVRDGGLMSYGPSFEDGFRLAARYIDRIVKGAKPADLPAEQPTQYYLAVNLKTAATLGLTFPPALVLRTDEVVQ